MCGTGIGIRLSNKDYIRSSIGILLLNNRSLVNPPVVTGVFTLFIYLYIYIIVNINIIDITNIKYIIYIIYN